MHIEVHNESGDLSINEDALVDISRYVLSRMDVHPGLVLTITLVDEPAIADLHDRWLGLPGPTDVMSFPMDELRPGSSRPEPTRPDSSRNDAADDGPEVPPNLGDIVLCPSFAARQAERAGHGLAHELALLTTHGCLHLLGYDHVEAAEEQEMFALQSELLADWYDDLERRGIEFEPKPTGQQAFPTASDRRDLED